MKLEFKQLKARCRFGGYHAQIDNNGLSKKGQRALRNYSRQKQFDQNYQKIAIASDEIRRCSALR